MIALLLAGTVALCGGCLTVLYGISIKEFSLGGTMILAGSVVACTGLLLIGLGLVLRELKNLPRRLGGEAVAAPPPVISLTPDVPRAPAMPEPSVAVPTPARPTSRPHGRADVLFSREETAVETELPPLDLPAERPTSSTSSPLSTRATPQSETTSDAPPWSDEQHTRTRTIPPIPRARDRVSDPSSERPGLGERAGLGERPNRNFLFSSRRREQAAAPPSPTPEPAPEESSTREAGADPHDTFEPPWTQTEPSRAEPDFTPASEAAPRPARPASSPRYQPPRRSEAASVTVVKSGVVDSMAYSLYSDGSIEAQMPEGMVRFESIEALRAHLEQRS